MSTSDSPAAPSNDSDSDNHGPESAIDFTDPNSPLAPFYFQAGHVAAAIILALVFVFYSLLVRLNHTDVWMHLKFGEWVVQNRELPKTELFSSFSDEPVINFQWLTQSFYYLLFQFGENLAGGTTERQVAGGVEMLRTFHALITTLRFWILLLAFRRLTNSMPLACAGVGLLLIISFGASAIQRPQAVGELFFAMLMFALSSPLLRRTAFVGLPILFAAWVNCHGSFLLGMMVLVIFVAGRTVVVAKSSEHGAIRSICTDSQLRRLFVVLLLAVFICGLLNPYGPSIFGYVGQLAKNPNIATLLEWQPLNFSERAGGHWAYLALLFLIVASQLMSSKSLGPTEILMLGSFGVFPLLQRRMMLWWVVVAVWILLPLWRETRERLPKRWTAFSTVPSFRKTILAATFVVLALVWSGPVGWLVSGRPTPLGASLSPETPWRIAHQLHPINQSNKRQRTSVLKEFLNRNYGGEFRGGVFSSDTLGDYLVWALPQKKMPVMVYAHAHLFPERYWIDYMTVQFGRDGWSHVLDRYGINLIIVERNKNYHQELIKKVSENTEWMVIESTNPQMTPFFIAVRKNPLL